MVMRIKVQYICMAFLYVGGFPLYAQKVTDDTISGKTHYIDEVTVKASVATRKVTSTTQETCIPQHETLTLTSSKINSTINPQQDDS